MKAITFSDIALLTPHTAVIIHEEIKTECFTYLTTLRLNSPELYIFFFPAELRACTPSTAHCLHL